MSAAMMASSAPPEAVEESCDRDISDAALAGYVAFVVLSMIAAFVFVAATFAFAVREAVKERNRTRERIEREELIAMEELQRQRFLMDRNNSVLCPVTGEYLPVDGGDAMYSRLPSEEWSDVYDVAPTLPHHRGASVKTYPQRPSRIGMPPIMNPINEEELEEELGSSSDVSHISSRSRRTGRGSSAAFANYNRVSADKLQYIITHLGDPTTFDETCRFHVGPLTTINDLVK